MEDCPVRPLAELLSNELYDSADAIVVNRVSWKNQAISTLTEDASVLESQTLRDVYHTVLFPKVLFTKVSCQYSYFVLFC
jgi:hypothetical protein